MAGGVEEAIIMAVDTVIVKIERLEDHHKDIHLKDTNSKAIHHKDMDRKHIGRRTKQAARD